MTNTTPNMDLVLPDVIMTSGPGYAYLINAAQYLIDSHDHSTGKGVLVTPAGLNISSDLTFNQHNATTLRTIRFFNNTTFTPGASDKGILYELNGELYYIDASGNNVQITLNGALDLSSGVVALTIKDSNLVIENATDISKKFSFSAANLTTATTYTFSLPATTISDNLVLAAATQTLTNKTLTSPKIATIVNGTYTFNLPTSDGTGGQVVQTDGSGNWSFATVPTTSGNIQSAISTGQTYTNASNRIQILNPTANRTDTLATTSIPAGDTWNFINRTTFTVTINSSGGNFVAFVGPNGSLTVSAAIATPTTAANWIVGQNTSYGTFAPVFSGGTGLFVGSSVSTTYMNWNQVGNIVNFSGFMQFSGGSADTSGSIVFTVPLINGTFGSASAAGNAASVDPDLIAGRIQATNASTTLTLFMNSGGNVTTTLTRFAYSGSYII